MSFQPIGNRARWRIAYDLLRATKEDEILTYEALGNALNLHPSSDRPTIATAVHQAAKRLEENDKRAIQCITNVGYRVVTAAEHLDLAGMYQAKSVSALERGHSKVVNVDMSGMASGMRRAFDAANRAFTAQLEAVHRLDVRQTRLEQAMEAVTVRQEDQENKYLSIEERLARLEQRDVS